MNLGIHTNSQASAASGAWLQLLHLADSALPSGATAHSFGVETLIAEAGLKDVNLTAFFEEWLAGQGYSEAVFCLKAHGIRSEPEWHALNAMISSYKPARETREASLRLGKRFLALSTSLIGSQEPRFQVAGNVHLAAAFGRVGSVLQMDAGMIAAAYLHQSIYGAIFACQRLLPLGQTAAMQLLWHIKPSLLKTVEEARRCACEELAGEELWNLQPMLEIASMRHPQLATRLFIS